MLGLGEGSSHLAEMEHRLERLDLLEQPVGQLLAGADRKAGDVVDRLFWVKLGALAAGLVENIDDMGLQPRKELKSLTVRTLANEVVIGLMSATLQRAGE